MRIVKKILYGVMFSVLCSSTLTIDHALAEGTKQHGKEAVVYFTNKADDTCRSQHNHFPLDKLRDLYVCVIWYHLAGTYVQQLAFYLPDGNLYQILTTPFTTPGASGPAAVDVDGRLSKVREGRWVGKEQTEIVTILPVAGTFITQRNLVGTWRVDVLLDDQLVEQAKLTLKTRGSDDGLD